MPRIDIWDVKDENEKEAVEEVDVGYPRDFADKFEFGKVRSLLGHILLLRFQVIEQPNGAEARALLS
jgi:hypothetical protein